MLSASKLTIADGVFLWPGALDAKTQSDLVAEVFGKIEDAPFYRPVMPGSGKAFSVEETNFGPLGWISDRDGYRYAPAHPVTKRPWPAIPDLLLNLWGEATGYATSPECCLVNLYRGSAKMGLHQDKDEAALAAPVLSVSLGNEAVFRIGAASRGGPTRSVKLASGDVLTFGGPARLAYHGIDRVMDGTSRLIPGGGRINLTLRRINP
jgi:alkylated DNA repair protein (DNA oxidative demethylase)